MQKKFEQQKKLQEEKKASLRMEGKDDKVDSEVIVEESDEEELPTPREKEKSDSVPESPAARMFGSN